jgi:flagellar biosynthetic protein FliR
VTIELGPDLATWALVPLAALRCLGAFAVAPLYGSRFVPAQLRVALGLACGVLLASLAVRAAGPSAAGQANPWAGIAGSPLAYGLQCGGEALFGLAVGYICLLFLSAIQIAGQVMDTEVGFAMVSVLDPQFGVQLPLIGSFLNVLGVLVFLALDGHLLLLRALRDSVLLIPLGGAGLPASVGALVLRAVAAAFVTALKLAAPVLAAMLLTSVAVGIVARSVPQMNVFVVGLPLRIAIGLAVLVLALPYFAALLAPALSDTFTLIDRLTAAVAGGR